MTVRIFTVKRLIIFTFATMAIGLVVLQQNFRTIAMSALNSLSSPYDIHVKNVDISVSSINQINFDLISLEYEDSAIELSNITLKLNDGVKALQKMSLSIEDITALTIGSVDVQLGHSFLKRRYLGKEENINNTESNIGLSFSHLPLVELNAININWTDDNPSREPFIQARNLSLFDSNDESDQHHINGTLHLMQSPLIDIELTMKKLEWVLNTDLDINKVIHSALAFNQSLIERQSQIKNTDELQGLKLLSQQLASLLSPVITSHFDFHGLWKSQSTLDLRNGSIISKHELKDVEITPTSNNPFINNIHFKANQPLSIDVSYQPQTVTQTINDRAKQISIILSPFSWQQTATKQDLISLSGYLNNDAVMFTDTLLNQLEDVISEANRLSDQLTQHNNIINWLVNFESPLALDISLANEAKNQSNEYYFFADQITVELNHPLMTAQIQLEQNNLVLDKNEHQLSSAIAVDITQNQSADLIALDDIEQSIVIDEFQLSTARSIHSSASKAIAAHSNATEILITQPTRIQMANMTLALGNKIMSLKQLDWQEKAVSKLYFDDDGMRANINSFALEFDQFSFADVIIKDGLVSGDESLDIKLGHFHLDAEQAISLFVPAKSQIKSQKTKNALFRELLAQNNKAKLTWQLNDFNIDKLTPNKLKTRRYPLVKLNSLMLDQTLNLQSQLLTGKELWQLDDLTLSSYHLLQLPKNDNPVSLAGQWHTESDLDQLLGLLEQTQMLPANLSISGHNKLDAGFALIESQGVSFFEMKFAQSLTNLEAQYNESFFYDGNINANCQFNWQQAHSTPLSPQTFSQSRLLCQETQVKVAEAYAGIKLEQLNFNANISLGKNDQIAPQNWLQEISGLSDTDINLTAEGKLLDGEFLLPEFHVKLHDKSEAYLMLNGISLQALLAAQPQVGVYADGIFDGVLPATLIDGKVNITGGHLAARPPGGLIKVSDNPALEQIKSTQPYLELVVQALEHLQYSELISTFDMQENGDAEFAIKVKGKSQDIERPIHLNYSHEENLFQLFKSTQIGNQLQNDIERSVK